MTRRPAPIAHLSPDGRVQLLENHLKGTAALAAKFALKVGMKEAGELIGLLHDIGKASQEFQNYIKSAVGLINPDEDDYVDYKTRRGRVDHSSSGAQFIYQNLVTGNSEVKFIAQVLSLCLASHHSGLIDCITPDGRDSYSARMRKKEEKTHFSEVCSYLSDETKLRITKMLQSKKMAGNMVRKFKSLKTPLDTKETLSFKYGLLTRFLFSCLIDADRLSTADFTAPGLAKLRNYGCYKKWTVLEERLNKKLAEFKPEESINIIRQKISNACYNFSNIKKGLYQLTVPTGGGKTLSSLRFALHHADMHKMDRIIYVLPYTTIIDQNAEEIRKILEEKDKKGRNLNRIVLEHHSNLMPDKETARQKILSENWDAPVVLTTNVQVLEALFGSGTRGARRMHQLANAVIIFDEVQILPIKCVQLFNTAVNFLVKNCGSTVVLCTATQPLLDKIEPKSRALSIMSGQQMVPDAKELFNDLKRVEVCDKTKIGGWENAEIKGLAERKVLKTGSVLIVVNTKTSAREIYRLCKQIDNVKVFHLSTNMCPAHRMTVLKGINKFLGQKKPLICVSTQLIEAGVDISFGAVIRFLAGLDSIVQSAGRCNRHNERYPSMGDVYVVNPKEENIARITAIKTGKEKSERILDEFKNNPGKYGTDILNLKAIEQFYKYYFYQRAEEMNYPVGPKSPIGRNDNLFNLLSVNKLSVKEHERVNNKVPGIPLRQSFMSASKAFEVIDAPTRGIVVPYGKKGKDIIAKLCAARRIDEQYNLIRSTQRYSVNVFPNVLEKLENMQAIHEVQKGAGIFYLDERYYSNKFGLNEILT